jgi:hypothetical protein
VFPVKINDKLESTGNIGRWKVVKSKKSELESISSGVGKFSQKQ